MIVSDRLPGIESSLCEMQAEFNHELWTEESMGQQLQACSLVLGLHPDQATDSIVNFAMQFGKPFAVVPCCVFPRYIHCIPCNSCLLLVECEGNNDYPAS